MASDGAAREPFVPFKYEVPVGEAGEVPRARIGREFAEVPERRLTVVAAPAGFGKTIALAQWAREREEPTAWLTLDELDDEPRRFLRGVIASVRRACPGMSDYCERLLDLGEPPPDEQVLDRLLDDLPGTGGGGGVVAQERQGGAAAPERPGGVTPVLVLDDYHLVSEPRVHAAVEFLVTRAQGRLALVVATRRPLPFSLAKLRLDGLLLEVDGEALRFTPDEARAFLHPRAFSEETARALFEATEGWIAGLKLALLSLAPEADPAAVRSLGAGAKPLAEYIVEEVLRRPDPETQRFLQQVSILDRQNASLCEAVTGESGAMVRLRALERENLFLAPLDSAQGWYRLHGLFRDVLRSGLETEDPDLARLLHRRAAGWFEDAGKWPEALSHAIRGEDWERVARIMRPIEEAMLATGSAQPLLHWLEKIPRSIRESNAGMSLSFAWANLLTGRLDRTEAPLARARALTDRTMHRERWLEIQTLAAHVERFRGEPRRSAELASEVLAEAEPGLVRLMASLALGIALGIDGQPRAACEELARCHALADAAGAEFAWFASANVLANHEATLGYLGRARDRMRASLERAGDLPDRHIIETHTRLGYIHREWLELEDAVHHLRRGIQLAEERGVHPLWCHADIALARIDRYRGDLDRAKERMETALSLIQRSGYRKAVSTVRAWQARLDLESGDLARARAWLAETESDAARVTGGVPDCVAARVLIASGRVDEAMHLVQAALAVTEREERLDQTIEFLLLRQRALSQAGRASEAVEALREVVAIAGVPQFLWTFVEELDDVGDALARLAPTLEDESERVFVERVLAERGETVSASPSNGAAKVLSEREQEVIAHIERGRSNQEIAKALYISNNTVKTHLRNIFEKLEVRNRTQAVSAFRELLQEGRD